MSTKAEILNIHYHVRRLVLKALNTAPNIEEAARLLGISERGLYNYKKQFKVIKGDTNQYLSVAVIKVNSVGIEV